LSPLSRLFVSGSIFSLIVSIAQLPHRL
jgi:hypothetical protein